MSVIVYANGYHSGEGTHASVYVHIVEGRNDSKLKWPFIGSAKIELLNQFITFMKSKFLSFPCLYFF